MKTYKNGERSRKLVMEMIDQYWKDHFHSPSIKDIGTEFGWSNCVVSYHINVLVAQQKLVAVKRYRSRNIVPVWVKDLLSQHPGGWNDVQI